MENASKALIIAGAILIAIILITVGIVVMNSMNSPIDNADKEIKSQTAQMFNKKFEKYAGEGKTAEQVKELMMLVNSNLASNHKVGFLKPNSGPGITNINSINESTTYKITVKTNLYDTKTFNLTNSKILYPGDSDLSDTVEAEPGYVYGIMIEPK